MQAPPGFWNKATPSAGEKSVPFEKTAAAVLLGPDRDGRPIMHLGRLGGELGSVTSSGWKEPVIGGDMRPQQEHGASRLRVTR